MLLPLLLLDNTDVDIPNWGDDVRDSGGDAPGEFTIRFGAISFFLHQMAGFHKPMAVHERLEMVRHVHK